MLKLIEASTEELTTTVLQYKMLDILHSTINHAFFVGGLVAAMWLLFKAVSKMENM